MKKISVAAVILSALVAAASPAFARAIAPERGSSETYTSANGKYSVEITIQGYPDGSPSGCVFKEGDTVIWSTVIPRTPSMVVISDNGETIAMPVWSWYDEGASGGILFYNGKGGLIIEESFGGPGNSDKQYMKWLKVAAVSPDGTGVILGEDGKEHARFTLFNGKTGAYMWEKEFGFEEASDAAVQDGGAHILLATNVYQTQDMQFILVDTQGAILWQKEVKKNFSWDVKDYVRFAADGFEWYDLAGKTYRAEKIPALPALSAQENSDVQSVVKGTNVFAYGLYGQIAKEGGNLFCSPYSISTALAMTYAGARGKTAEQMASVLGFTLPADKLNPALSQLMASFNAKDMPYQLLVANALWAQTGYAFDPAFLAVTKKYYGAGFKEVDYVSEVKREETRLEINAWTAKQTADKIKDLIGEKVLTEMTRLVLTNAIYFKGTWQFQFKKEATKDMSFAFSQAEKKPVPMMHQTTKFKYAEDESVQVLEMPYTGGDLSMVIILPRESYGVDKLQGDFSKNLDRWVGMLSEQKVEVFVPRFKLETSFVLNDQLIALGMADAFDESAADFSGMTPDAKGLYISKVIHKAFVDVNEEGTEAAAATAVVMATKSATAFFEKPPVFKADRPFVFLIRDLRTGMILFMGRLSDPA